MQLFFDRSEEGEGEGIGIIPGSVGRLTTHTVPQMGWNDVELGRDSLFQGLEGLVTYYANSFVCAPTDPQTVIATSHYQRESFPAGVKKGMTWGVQFHPEKSSAPGLRIIENFLEGIE